MTGKLSAALSLLILGFASTALAADRMRLVSVPLDMPLEDTEALDNQAIEGLYQGDYGTNMKFNYGDYLSGHVKSSGLEESPFYHIDTVLKDGRTLELWFSSAADGRKTFGVHLEVPWRDKPVVDFTKATDELEAAWGKPDLQTTPSQGGPHIAIFVDRTVPSDSYQHVLAHLPAADKMNPKDVQNFWQSDLREWARILGPDFRGAIALMNEQNGKLSAEQVILIDLAHARSVFNLTP